LKLSRIIELDNLADHLDEEQLRRIGEDVVEGYKRDLQSREAWEEKNADALKLALQFSEKKTFPWPNASNIKYPLVLLSCVQFNSRAYPAMVPGERVVEIRKSPKMDLQASEMATAAADEMNWQIMEGGEDDNWEDGHDLMLMMVPLIGTVFKKTYYDAEKGKNCSYPILPSNFVVDYWAKNLVQCARKTHVHQFDENHVESQKRLEYYRDVEYGKHVPQASEIQDVADDARGFERPQTQGYTFLEQCCWIDLDEDGYKEPYVVTVDLASGQVARIVENFKEITLVRNGIRLKIKPGEYNDDMAVMKVAKITEQQYYTKYGFIRSPDGGSTMSGLARCSHRRITRSTH
jgi:chaperonin GroES